MEEDIKILEEIKKKFEKTMKIIVLGEYSTYVDNSIFEDIKKLINISENLIARYKQLEEENTQLKTITQEYNSYLQDSNCDTKIIIADSEYFANGYFKENFIPKSRVKEKIEELKKRNLWRKNNITTTFRRKHRKSYTTNWLGGSKMNEIKQKVEELEEVYNKNVIYVKNNINIPELIKDFKFLLSENERLINLNKNLLETINKLKRRSKSND